MLNFCCNEVFTRIGQKQLGRTAGSDGARTEELIRKTAIELIAKHGFEAMTLRQLAEQVGVQPGSIYRYFPSKGKLLAQLQVEHLEFLLGRWAAEAPQRGSSVLSQLKGFVDFHIRYHTLRRQEVFVANMELRSLEAEDYKQVVTLRRRYEKILQNILLEGVSQGLFRLGRSSASVSSNSSTKAAVRPSEITVTSFALLAMLTGVGTWFNESGRMAKQDLINLYTQMVFQSLGVALLGKGRVGTSGVLLEHA
jgi:AcrR family transcriptional regulator